MLEIPLFPLNTVLFPQTPLRLHIFEDRYKRMINTCLEAQQPFGVVLIRRGAEALGPLAEPFPIGCTAQISSVQRLNEGRMNLVANGGERFRILSLDRSALPYLVAKVELYPLAERDSEEIAESGRHLRYWFRRYIKLLTQAENTQFDLSQVPEEPVSLAYFSAALMQIPALTKQQLLSIHGAIELLSEVRKIFRREVVLLKMMMENEVEEKGAFSVN